MRDEKATYVFFCVFFLYTVFMFFSPFIDMGLTVEVWRGATGGIWRGAKISFGGRRNRSLGGASESRRGAMRSMEGCHWRNHSLKKSGGVQVKIKGRQESMEGCHRRN